MDKPLLTQDLYDAIISDNSKFKEYWNTHPEEVEEICRKFSEKYMDVRCKYLKVERSPLSCEEGFVYPGDIISCLKKDRELLDIFECEDCKFYEAGGRIMVIPKYIRSKMHLCARHACQAATYNFEVANWLEKHGIDVEDISDGDGSSFEELMYGNDVTDELCARIEAMEV